MLIQDDVATEQRQNNTDTTQYNTVLSIRQYTDMVVVINVIIPTYD